LIWLAGVHTNIKNQLFASKNGQSAVSETAS
jgi:hypothetical protein